MDICRDILSRMDTKLNKSFSNFLIETLMLYIIIPNKINFLQLGRYSESCEQRFRQNFTKDFDWLEFNSELSKDILTGSRVAIAIDPSFITKSGKKTPYIGRFWSGCSAKAMRGLEILGVGLIDADDKDCVSLYSVQTPDSKTLNTVEWTLVDWYLFALEKKKKQLLKLSKHVVADAWFAKSNFVEGLDKMDFHLISRFRDDVNLMYLTSSAKTGRKGRPKKFDGKIDFTNLDKSRFEELKLEYEGKFYTSLVHSKALNGTVRIVIMFADNGKTHKIYFTTDISLSGKDIIELYKTRFQIEFCFRDAKQYTGLCNSQSRNAQKMKFNYNASLSVVNLVKAWAIRNNRPYSIASVKTMMHNAFLLQRFIALSGIRPNRNLNNKLVKELIEFAAIAA